MRFFTRPAGFEKEGNGANDRMREPSHVLSVMLWTSFLLKN